MRHEALAARGSQVYGGGGKATAEAHTTGVARPQPQTAPDPAASEGSSEPPKSDNSLQLIPGEPCPTCGHQQPMTGAERVRRDIGAQQQLVIDILRERKVSWSDIGESLGVSRQAVWRRFGASDAR